MGTGQYAGLVIALTGPDVDSFSLRSLESGYAESYLPTLILQTRLAGRGEIGGVVWSDPDGDATRDAGESGMAGVSVYVDMNNNGRQDFGEPSTVTAADDPGTPAVDEAGTYRFPDLVDQYTIARTVPDGHRQSAPAIGTGQMSFVQMIQDGVGGVDGLDYARALQVSPVGSHVYASGYNDDSLAVFSRDASTSQLSFVQQLKDGLGAVDGLNGAAPVALDPTGAHVYVGSQVDLAVAVFSHNATTGVLTFVHYVKDGAGVTSVTGSGAAYTVTVATSSGDGSCGWMWWMTTRSSTPAATRWAALTPGATWAAGTTATARRTRSTRRRHPFSPASASTPVPPHWRQSA